MGVSEHKFAILDERTLSETIILLCSERAGSHALLPEGDGEEGISHNSSRFESLDTCESDYEAGSRDRNSVEASTRLIRLMTNLEHL